MSGGTRIVAETVGGGDVPGERSVADDLRKRGVLAKRRQVVIIAGELGRRRREFNGPPQMRESHVDPTRSTLEAGDVVVHRGVGWVIGDQRLGTVSTLVVVAGFEQWNQRCEQLPAAGLVRLPRRPAAEGKHPGGVRLGLNGPPVTEARYDPNRDSRRRLR